MEALSLLPSVQRAVGVEKAEGRGGLFLTGGIATLADGRHRVLADSVSVLVGAPAQKRELFRDFLGFYQFCHQHRRPKQIME